MKTKSRRTLRRPGEQRQREIGERKQTQCAPRQPKELFEKTFHSQLDAIFILDAGNPPRILDCNPATVEVFGHTREEMLGQTIAFLHVDNTSLRDFQKHLYSAIENRGFLLKPEFRMKRKDGTVFPTEQSVAPLKSQEDELMGWVSVIRDVTERKLAEEALRESEAKYSAVVEQARDGVFIVQGGKLKFANRAMTNITGYSVEELLSMPLLDLIVPESRGEAAERYRLRMAGEQDLPINEARIRCKGGTIKEVGVSARLMQYEGEPAITGIVRDITERKRAGQNLQQAYEEELRLRRELDAEMSKRVEFLRALVHELKTPLTSAMASSEILSSRLPKGPALSLAQNLYRSTSRLNKRIDELLDLARGEVGMLHLRCRPTDMLPVLQGVFDDMTTVVSRRGQELALDVPSSLPLIWADEQRLSQVVLNLLSNASKFMPGEGKITLRARKQDAALVVEVQDTGPGIAKEEQQRLFDAYYRLASDREHLSGLGLGLAFSKTLVELHGGTIWVRSRKGKGSTFGFSLPLYAAVRRKTRTKAKNE